MGANLFVAALPAVDLSVERRERLHAIVSGLSEQELQQLDPDDWDAGGPGELRRQLHEYVSALRGPDERRDVIPLHAPLMPYGLWVTGGLSWGGRPDRHLGLFLPARLLPGNLVPAAGVDLRRSRPTGTRTAGRKAVIAAVAVPWRIFSHRGDAMPLYRCIYEIDIKIDRESSEEAARMAYYYMTAPASCRRPCR